MGAPKFAGWPDELKDTAAPARGGAPATPDQLLMTALFIGVLGGFET